MNEKALIKRCQRGDRQAFDELIRLYYDYVSGFLRKATENETLCEDLTQETFLKMIRSIERFDPGGSASFGTWLITIARNCYIDQLRRNRILLEDIDSIQLEDARNVANEVERRLQYEQIMSGHGNASAGTGAGHPAEICGGHDPCADRRALRRTAQNHQKPHPRRYGKAAEKTQGKERISMDPLELVKAGSEKKYLPSAAHPDAVFQYVKSEEFMINSIINKDFGKIRSDYDDDSAFESRLAQKTIYMLSRVGIHGSDGKVYVITVPTTVPGGMTAIKVTAALAMLFFCVYWVLIALWMYRDAAKCRLSSLYWGLIGLFTNLIGLIVYKIYKRSMAVCTVCGAAQSAEHLYCSFCGTQLGVRCEGCGCKVGPKDSFCHRCDKKIK